MKCRTANGLLRALAQHWRIHWRAQRTEAVFSLQMALLHAGS
jgi:hypothetical protein